MNEKDYFIVLSQISDYIQCMNKLLSHNCRLSSFFSIIKEIKITTNNMTNHNYLSYSNEIAYFVFVISIEFVLSFRSLLELD